MSKKHIDECVRESLEGYFRDLRGGETPTACTTCWSRGREAAAGSGDEPRRPQPVARRRMAGPEPQHAAQEAGRAQAALSLLLSCSCWRLLDALEHDFTSKPITMNALISVSDKTGIVEFAKALHALGIKLLSTGGTAKLLAEAGLPVTEVAEVTQLPRDAGRPRQDAAPQGPRRPAGAARRARAHGGAARSTASTPSTCWWSTSTPSRPPWPRPAARWKTRSRTSTSAARPWCAAPPRTGRTWAC
jgi:hypothetical protein